MRPAGPGPRLCRPRTSAGAPGSDGSRTRRTQSSGYASFGPVLASTCCAHRGRSRIPRFRELGVSSGSRPLRGRDPVLLQGPRVPDRLLALHLERAPSKLEPFDHRVVFALGPLVEPAAIVFGVAGRGGVVDFDERARRFRARIEANCRAPMSRLRGHASVAKRLGTEHDRVDARRGPARRRLLRSGGARGVRGRPVASNDPGGSSYVRVTPVSSSTSPAQRSMNACFEKGWNAAEPRKSRAA